MNPTRAGARAIEWLEAQLGDLANIRNASPRDPSFKNWRQATLTVMQRIWPGDQVRSERFRRIPFSPPDPRSDARTVREAYSRGCQEAARILNGFIDEIRAEGVPDVPGDGLPESHGNEFEDGFPTVDLPAGDIGGRTSIADMAANMLADLADAPPQGTDPSFDQPSRPQFSLPPVSEPEERPARKGLNMKARLRDLLGLAPPSTKAHAGSTDDAAPDRAGGDDGAAADPAAGAAVAPPVVSAPKSGEWPLPGVYAKPPAPVEPTLPSAAAEGTAQEQSPSALMSRSTTLRRNIEKVSIESLISAEFRTAAAPASELPAATAHRAAETPLANTPAPASAPPAPNVAPVASAPPSAAAPAPPPALPGRPKLSLVPPFADDPEFSMGPSPSGELSAPRAAAPGPPLNAPLAAPAVRGPARVAPPPARPHSSVGDDAFEPEPHEPAEPPAGRVDPEAFARATDDFMRSSPVLGATGRKVHRGFDDSGFGDADAIAVSSMAQDLTRMAVPDERHAEVRARLMDLARRLERAELEWSALRKAVWFAMEYPELARRLMPVLLPWIDRAA